MKYVQEDGFTFIETIVVITIILILSAGIGLSAMGFIDRAKEASAKNQIATYKIALQSYYLDCGAFPSTEQDLISLWIKPVLSPVPDGWNGPYIDQEIGKDPWGADFHYYAPGENGLPYSIISFGADKKKGGEGLDEDIISWKR